LNPNLHLLEANYSSGVTSRKRQKWRNSVRPRQGLPQRGDIVFIAEALSQVSHPWAGRESEKKI